MTQQLTPPPSHRQIHFLQAQFAKMTDTVFPVTQSALTSTLKSLLIGGGSNTLPDADSINKIKDQLSNAVIKEMK